MMVHGMKGQPGMRTQPGTQLNGGGMRSAGGVCTRIRRASTRRGGPQPVEASKFVITGGARGIGRALTEELLRSGETVLITSKSEESAKAAGEELACQHGSAAVHSCKCDVSQEEDVMRLEEKIEEELDGEVDGWVLNAGTNAYIYEELERMPEEALREIVMTNCLGPLLTSRVAVRMSRRRDKPSHIFLLEGAGSGGEPTRKFAAYGFSKAGARQLQRSLELELRGSAVYVHTVSPGLVWTSLIQAGQEAFGERGRVLINLVAETPQRAAKVIAPKLQSLCGRETPRPRNISALQPSRFIRRASRWLLTGTSPYRFY